MKIKLPHGTKKGDIVIITVKPNPQKPQEEPTAEQIQKFKDSWKSAPPHSEGD